MEALEATSSDRAAWIEERKGKIGGSDIAVIAGLNPYKSVLQLWAEWTNKVPVEVLETPAMKFGRLVEPAIRELFADAHPELTVRPNTKTFIYQANPRFIATPDALLIRKPDDVGTLEIKNTRDYANWDDGIPDVAHCQVIWQMGICNLQWGWVTGVIRGNANERKEKEIQFAQDIFDQLVERAESFLEHVQSDIPPDPGPTDSKLIDTLTERHEKTVELGQDALEQAERISEAQKMLKDLNAEVKHWDGQKKDAENKLKALMKDATEGYMPNGARVLLTKVERDGYTTQPTSYWTIKVKTQE